MEKVTMYRCRWCGKNFKTPSRHDCRFDPGHRNCLSCKFRGAFVKGDDGGYVGFGHIEDAVPDGFMCEKDTDPEVGKPGQGWWNDFPSAIARNTDGGCPDYEIGDRFKSNDKER